MLFSTPDRNLDTPELGRIGELVGDGLLVPVEPDYEAAYQEGIQQAIGGNRRAATREANKAIVDAALKGDKQ